MWHSVGVGRGIVVSLHGSDSKTLPHPHATLRAMTLRSQLVCTLRHRSQLCGQNQRSRPRHLRAMRIPSRQPLVCCCPLSLLLTDFSPPRSPPAAKDLPQRLHGTVADLADRCMWCPPIHTSVPRVQHGPAGPDQGLGKGGQGQRPGVCHCFCLSLSVSLCVRVPSLGMQPGGCCH